MKKAVLILAAILVFSTLAFATPEFGLGIWGRTQFTLAQGSDADSNIYQGWSDGIGNMWNWNPDYEPGFWFIGEAADFNLAWQINNGNGYSFTPMNMFATLRIVPDLLTVRFGRNTMNGLDTYRRADAADDQNKNTGRMGGQGFWVTVEPKDTNFSATVFYQTPTFNASEVRTIMENAHLTELVMAYTIPDIVKITAGTQTVGTLTDGSGSTTDYGNLYESWATTALVRYIFGRADILAVDGLSCFVDVVYSGFEPAADGIADTRLDAMIDAYYTGIENLTVWLVPKMGMQTPKAGGDATIPISVRAGASYAIGDIVPGLSVTYATTLSTPSVDNMAISVTPSVHFNKFAAEIAADINYASIAGISTTSWKVRLFVDSSYW